jgi:MFS-type transporter involved in bile tolerance (Atg22 family)
MKYIKWFGILFVTIVITFLFVGYVKNQNNNPLVIDTSKCILKNYPSGDIYGCPNSSLAEFSGLIVRDTKTKNKCTVSYSFTDGFSFKKDLQLVSINSKDLEITKDKNNEVTSIAALNGALISLYLDKKMSVKKVVIIGIDNTISQCLSTEN